MGTRRDVKSMATKSLDPAPNSTDPSKACSLLIIKIFLKMATRSCSAWLAAVKAIDALLATSGLGPGESHRDRRDKLRQLEEAEPRYFRLGLRDRYMARMSYLHVDGFYEGTLSPEEAEEQMDKVEELISDVETLLKRGRA